MNKPLRKWWAAPIIASVCFVMIGTASPIAFAQTQPTEEQKTEPPPPPPPPPPPTVTYPSMGPTRREIMVGPETYFRFGVFAQFWANYAQSGVKPNATDEGGYSIDLYLRRVRFFVFAQWFKNFNMFFLLDSPNMGRGAAPNLADGNLNKTFTPANPPGNFIGDAFFEFKLADDQFMIEGGLMVLPFSHAALGSTGSYIQLDLNPVSATINSQDTAVVRDVGLQFKGYLLEDKLEYRVGAFQGARQPAFGTNPASHNAPLVAAKLQYQIFDPEKGYVYSGHAFGRKKLLGVSAGFEWQKNDLPDPADPFIAISAGVFGAWPLSGEADPRNGGDEIAFQAEYYRYDGGSVFPTSGAGAPLGALPLLKQNSFDVQAGYYNKEAKLSVFGFFQMRKLDSSVTDGSPALAVNKLANTMWFGGGIKYYLAEAAANVTLQYQRIQFSDKEGIVVPGVVPFGANDINQITLQLQATYF